MRYFILFVFASFLFISCGNETETSVKTAPAKVQPKTRNIQKAKNQNQNVYWAFMQKNAKISDLQLSRIKAINKKYTIQTQTLKKQKKWVGATNAAKRNSITTNKSQEIKKVLGTKWKNWAAAHKKWVNKGK